jgi:hypothetical protein
MNKFIQINKKNIDVVRAKMMLKLSVSELESINKYEQNELNFKRKKN